MFSGQKIDCSSYNLQATKLAINPLIRKLCIIFILGYNIRTRMIVSQSRAQKTWILA